VRLRILVGDLHVAPDGSLEIRRAAVSAASNLFLGQLCEPALDHVDPRRARRREVQVETRTPRKPSMDRRRLVRAGVVENQMHVEFGWNGPLDAMQETPELAGAVASVDLAQDLASLRV